MIRIPANAVPDEGLFSSNQDNFRMLTSVVVRDGCVFLSSSGSDEIIFDRDVSSPTTKGTSKKVLFMCRNVTFEVSRERNCSLEGEVTADMKGKWGLFWSERKKKVISSVSHMAEFIKLLESFVSGEPVRKRSKLMLDEVDGFKLVSLVMELKDEVKRLSFLIEDLHKRQNRDQDEQGDDRQEPDPVPEEPLVDILMSNFRANPGVFFDVEEIEHWDQISEHSELSSLQEKLELMQSMKMIVGSGDVYALPVKKTR